MNNSYLVPEEQAEFFKSDDKISISIPIPYVSQKSNLRQYLKQHIEMDFFHNKITFAAKSNAIKPP